MTYKFDGFNWLVRFDKDELLIESLSELFEKEDLPSAWLSGLGGAIWAELAFYDLNRKQYKVEKIDRLLEITNLSGNIAWSDGKPQCHIHGSFSDEQMNGFGGHVKELKVAGTCEILLHRWYGDKLQRSIDSDTGLNLLDL